jgi:hypothetical protein
MLHGKGNFVGVFRLDVTPFGHAACAQDDKRWDYGSMMRVSAISTTCRYWQNIKPSRHYLTTKRDRRFKLLLSFRA